MKNTQTLVVKVGTNVLTNSDGTLDTQTMRQLVSQIADLKKQGMNVLLVSSGAMGAGRAAFKISGKSDTIAQRQVYAAVGQIHLMNTYSKLFAKHDLHCAQVLAVKEDFRDRSHYLNMRGCFEALLKENIVPIINENDVVAISELMFTDNDELAGLVASMIDADKLIILSNIDGVYDGDPSNPKSKVITEIDLDDAKTEHIIHPSKSSFGRGGMHTKFRMARKVAQLGIQTIIANGEKKDVLPDLASGKQTGTRFKAKPSKSRMKKWIAFNAQTSRGNITINTCAVDVLKSPERTSSLLPVGITKIEGEFDKGDILNIIDQKGTSIGLGIAQYGAQAAHNALGKKGKKPLIHYDYLLIF